MTLLTTSHPVRPDWLTTSLPDATGQGLADLYTGQERVIDKYTTHDTHIGVNHVVTSIQRLGDQILIEQSSTLEAPGHEAHESSLLTRIHLQYLNSSWQAKVTCGGEHLDQEMASQTAKNVLELSSDS